MSSGEAGGGVHGWEGGKKAFRLRVGSWNIGTLTGKSIELGNILQKRKINIACVQETRWKSTRARDVDGFKLWYSWSAGGNNGVGLDQEVKEQFWEDLDEMVRSIPHTEKLFIGGDINGHIGASARGYDDVHGGYGFGDRNEGGNAIKGDASSMCFTTANCIRVAAREVLGVTKGSPGGHKGDWWWNGEVQGKEEAKKVTYLKLVESTNEEEKRTYRDVTERQRKRQSYQLR
uniref:Uncharacterized protein LOC104220728 n=1 Tax=Nicotiana sylvestris TaxID=4096 RepID=A0A1U7W5Q4_NICSY|nr:PREDICTED: uncharacterized protein LOC104220728 [Nicotiana sylvestris]